MKTLVSPTDFSDLSLNAVNYAAEMACVIGADLSLVHVCLIPMAFSEVPALTNSGDDLVKDAEKNINQLKENILTRTGGRLQVNTAVRQGSVVQEIGDYCASINTYAVVMGAESGGVFERFLLGGKTVSAVKQLAWPMIIVPPGAKFTCIKKLGLACDFRKVAETIPIKEIKTLVNEFHAEFHVLHVSNEGGDAFSNEKVEESSWLQEILGELKPKYHFIRGTDIEKSITEFAEKNKLDLLIVIPKKHNFFSKMFRQSLSKQLVLHSHVPLMAIHE